MNKYNTVKIATCTKHKVADGDVGKLNYKALSLNNAFRNAHTYNKYSIENFQCECRVEVREEQ